MPVASPRASAAGFPPPSLDPGGDKDSWLREIAESVRLLFEGKINTVITVTLDANSLTTTVSDKRIGRNTTLLPMPTTVNAAAGMTSLYQTFPNASTESAVLNHANNAQTDRTYRMALLG